MRNVIKTAVILLLACGTVVSCRLIPQIVLFNRTGQDITVQLADDAYAIKNGTSLTFRYPGLTSNILNLNITSGENKWTYVHFPYPPLEYCQPRGRERIKMQIEPTGFVYMLNSTNTFPLANLSGQPEGFPLKPEEEKPNKMPEDTARKLADPQH